MSNLLKHASYLNTVLKSPTTRDMFLGNKFPRSDARHAKLTSNYRLTNFQVVSRTLFHSYCSFDRLEKFRTFIYFNFGVLLQENYDVIPETGYGASITIYHGLDNT